MSKNFCHLYMLHFEKNNLLGKPSSLKYVFSLIIFTIFFFELINNLSLNDSVFYLYLLVALLRILSIWYFLNRNVSAKSYLYGLVSAILFGLSDMAWAINIIVEAKWVQILLVFSAFVYFLADFFLFEAFIVKYQEKNA